MPATPEPRHLVRRASVADAEELQVPYADFHPELARLVPADADLREWLEALLEHRDVEVYIATRGADLGGFATVRFSLGGQATLEDLYVVPEWRRSGTGRQLLQHAIHAARARGASVLELETGAENAAAQALYRAHGFRLSASGGGRWRFCRDLSVPQT